MDHLEDSTWMSMPLAREGGPRFEGRMRSDEEGGSPLGILEAVFLSMGDGVAVVDRHGRFVLLNPMAQQIFGALPPADLPLSQWSRYFGIYLPDTVTPHPVERLPLSLALLRGEAVDQAEVFVRNQRHPNGLWLLVGARVLTDAEGEMYGAVSVFRDITAIKQTEAALRAEEEKFRNLYKNTPAMMHSIDAEGRLVSVSEYWLRTLGYSREEVLGRRSVDFFTPESRRYASEHVLPEFFQTGACKDVPYQIVKKDGQVLDVLLSAISEQDASGRMVRSLAVLTDVTERKRAEDALAESEKRLRAILDNANAVFFILDRQERYIFVNREWERIFHHSLQEVAGKSTADLFSGALAERFRETSRAVFESGELIQREERIPLDDGVHTHLTQKFPLIDASGTTYALCGISTDVTDLKQMELGQRFLAEASQALVTSLDSETTLQRVAELAVPTLGELCVVSVLDRESVLRPVAVAASASEGCHRVREFLQAHPPVRGARQGPYVVLETGQVASSPRASGLLDPEALKDAKWSAVRALEARASLNVPLRARGPILGVLSVVSAQPGLNYGPQERSLAVELGLRAAFAIENAELYREAQESIRARDEFLSIASHELKTPVTSMKLRVQQLGRTLARQDSGQVPAEKVTAMLDVFGDQLRRLSHLVDHLLDVSRVNERRVDLRREEMDLAQVARDVSGHLRGQMGRARCAFELVAPTPVIGRWDRLRMEQVMINLLTNAMKYGAGGPIHMEVSRAGAGARLRIQDHGVGIPLEAQSRIFERFERAASRNYGGLGLGLFISRRLVEAHGGTIRVESQPGHGATFIVELPLEPPPP
ncbi:PAS domain S-box protein [Corallococcus macrosporus]|uniref:histidine kinase n=1 Tax=Myxococcus fulvus (strain ATCC BAA-855 / HW-1) TaxID=483219 RepID=F8CAF2_MYXFH|nr:PAS domain S-box protein [Corallococcus macrosporus]AEI65810.1 sensory box histidine kinase [Corallococcus macrosporus]